MTSAAATATSTTDMVAHFMGMANAAFREAARCGGIGTAAGNAAWAEGERFEAVARDFAEGRR